MSRIVRRPLARQEIIESYRYFARAAEVAVADRIFSSVEETLDRLARMPGLGTRYLPKVPVFSNIRYLPVSGLRSFLVFYAPLSDGIEVFRVLHGARDLNSILAEEFGLPLDVDKVDEEAEGD